MRENNIYWEDYEKQLQDAGITPWDQMQDIHNLIKGKDDSYDGIRDGLQAMEGILTNGTTKRGRKTYTMDDLAEFICIPAHRLDMIVKQFPLIERPIGDGRYNVWRDLSPQAIEECKLLHWIFIELGTIARRIKGGETYQPRE